jgi:tetratricopeptide (TPR) repeat protein
MMKSLRQFRALPFVQRAAFLVICAANFSGCASWQSAQPRGNIEIDEEVGFTITEPARVTGSVRADYQTALGYLEQGRHAEGVKLLEIVASETPDSSAPRIDLGIAYRRAGDFESAERNLLLALDVNPEHPAAHNELGIVHRHTGRFSEARASYEAALAIYPDFHYARRNLAVLCDLYLADLSCALDNYEAYMTTVHSDEEASIWIADIRARLGRESE